MKLATSLPLFLRYISAHNAENTIDEYTRRLSRFADWIGGRKVTREVMVGYDFYLINSGLSPRTVNLHMETVRNLYHWLIENEFVKRNPVGKNRRTVPSHAPKVPFTDHELQRLVGNATGHWEYGVIFGNETALRLGDVANMKWLHNGFGVDLDKCSVRWIPMKTIRYQKVVEIPFDLDCLAILEKMKLRAGSSEYVAPSMVEEWTAHNHRSLSMQFCRLVTKAGIVGKSFHNLRATAICRWLRAGLSPTMVCSMTAHHIGEIMSYVTHSVEEKREAMEKAVNQ